MCVCVFFSFFLEKQVRWIYWFFPPQEKNPLTKPLMPACCCWPRSTLPEIAWRLLWTLSSNDGNVRWFSAKSNRTGLHGMGLNGGGRVTRLRRFLLVNDKSSKYVSKRSINGWERDKNEFGRSVWGRRLLFSLVLSVLRVKACRQLIVGSHPL